jgi:hypothetical protein
VKAFLAICMIGLVGAALTVVVPPLFARFLHQPLPIRVLLCVLFLVPVGLFMGMPFPLGIRILAGSKPQSIPWAWAINAYTSVLGSALSIVLGMTYGFRFVLLLAVGTYLVGGLAMLCFRGAGSPPAALAVAEESPDADAVAAR